MKRMVLQLYFVSFHAKRMKVQLYFASFHSKRMKVQLYFGPFHAKRMKVQLYFGPFHVILAILLKTFLFLAILSGVLVLKTAIFAF